MRSPVVLLVALAGLVAAPAADAAVPPPANAKSTAAPPLAPATVAPEAVKAVAGKRGISATAAKARLERERDLGARGKQIERSIAGHTGGSYLDADGKLVVTTLDSTASATVTQSDARAKRVDDSAAKLDGIIGQLNRQADKSGAGATQGWYVDVPTNTVVVTVSEGANDAATHALTALARSFGDSVRIEQKPASQAPRPAEYLVGGQEFLQADGQYVCSVGFNTRDAANRDVVLTAGHCTTKAGTISRNGYSIGGTRTANYPNDDFGTFWNSYAWYWQPSVSVSLYNGTYARLAGQWDNPPIGATVCKSGRTTFFTCGRITGKNVSVNYGNLLLHGLVQNDACVEGGDSGGSNISAGYYALGVTSGARTPISGTYKDKCLSKAGQANVSWYQPVGEALTRNGLRLLY
jgi:streptogrisin C